MSGEHPANTQGSMALGDGRTPPHLIWPACDGRGLRHMGVGCCVCWGTLRVESLPAAACGEGAGIRLVGEGTGKGWREAADGALSDQRVEGSKAATPMTGAGRRVRRQLPWRAGEGRCICGSALPWHGTCARTLRGGGEGGRAQERGAQQPAVGSGAHGGTVPVSRL